MAKAFKPKVIAANDLVEGDSVYLSAAGWVRQVADAWVAKNPDDLTVLETLAKAGERDNQVVGAYPVEVTTETGAPWPISRREQIKASRMTTIAVGPAADQHHSAAA
ncbi:MAG: DUF2849 domain-containing protein [Pseudomonadota bacterium]